MDWEKIHQLLNIANLARQWPKECGPIHTAALAELEKLAKPEAKVESTMTRIRRTLDNG